MPNAAQIQHQLLNVRVDLTHGPAALKKPLLLLCLLDLIRRTPSRDNRFHFEEIESRLDSLLRQFGGKTFKAGTKPEQPFFYLKNDGFWTLHGPPGKNLTTATHPELRVLRDPACHGAIEEHLFRALSSDPQLRDQICRAIIAKWWPEGIQTDILIELGLKDGAPSASDEAGRQRSAEFRRNVLENYYRKCSFCGFTALLSDAPFGLDAAHIKWHSMGGPDTASNGLALCRIHHVCFDRGALGVDPDSLEITVSPAVIGQDESAHHIIHGLAGRKLHPWREVEPDREQLHWHRRNIFRDGGPDGG